MSVEKGKALFSSKRETRKGPLGSLHFEGIKIYLMD
jgi:hypothetical protein